MIFVKLFYNFFIVGLFSFGGAYSAIPLVKDAANNFANIDDQMLADFIAISESTPGPVAVNLATFVGATVAGIPGAIIATIAEILPAFIIILVITIYLNDFLKNERVKKILSVIRPSVIGIIMSVGVYMLYSNIQNVAHRATTTGLMENVSEGVDIKAIIILIIILLVMYIYKKVKKKSLGTIKLIILGGILGIAINLLM